MCKEIRNILVTGGCGFIGSQFVRDSLQRGDVITVADSLTYAGDLKRIATMPCTKFRYVNILNTEVMDEIVKMDDPDIVVHFAAETHVDRSINDSRIFLDTNLIGTHNILELVKKYKKRLIYISTDEVYGEIKEGKFTEESPIKPNNPYAVSKASADLLVQSYIRTYGIRVNIIRPCNNYGIWQYPEKLIPVVVYKALMNEKIPIYGQGLQIREWLNIQDTSNAIRLIIEKAPDGEIYNVGSGEENINVVRVILNILDKPCRLIEYVQDRPGHDFRYSLDYTKIKSLGWSPKVEFYRGGLEEVVEWNVSNNEWIKSKIGG